MSFHNRMTMAAGLMAIALPVVAAAQDSFLGVFTLDRIPVAGCEVVNLAPSLFASSYGYGFYGRDKDLDGLVSVDQAVNQVRDQLGELAIEGGFDAVIGARVEVSFSADSVAESGRNHFSGNNLYSFSGSYFVLGSGTPVDIVCR